MSANLKPLFDRDTAALGILGTGYIGVKIMENIGLINGILTMLGGICALIIMAPKVRRAIRRWRKNEDDE